MNKWDLALEAAQEQAGAGKKHGGKGTGGNRQQAAGGLRADGAREIQISRRSRRWFFFRRSPASASKSFTRLIDRVAEARQPAHFHRRAEPLARERRSRPRHVARQPQGENLITSRRPTAAPPTFVLFTNQTEAAALQLSALPRKSAARGIRFHRHADPLHAAPEKAGPAQDRDREPRRITQSARRATARDAAEAPEKRDRPLKEARGTPQLRVSSAGLAKCQRRRPPSEAESPGHSPEPLQIASLSAKSSVRSFAWRQANAHRSRYKRRIAAPGIAAEGLTRPEIGLGYRQDYGKCGPSCASEIPEKSLFRIGEVSRLTATKAFVLRYWETEFPTLAAGEEPQRPPPLPPRGHRDRLRNQAAALRRGIHDRGRAQASGGTGGQRQRARHGANAARSSHASKLPAQARARVARASKIPARSARGTSRRLDPSRTRVIRSIAAHFVRCGRPVGTWRSLVARTLGVREVAGSNPVVPTIPSSAQQFGGKSSSSRRHPQKRSWVPGMAQLENTRVTLSCRIF